MRTTTIFAQTHTSERTMSPTGLSCNSLLMVLMNLYNTRRCRSRGCVSRRRPQFRGGQGAKFHRKSPFLFVSKQSRMSSCPPCRCEKFEGKNNSTFYSELPEKAEPLKRSSVIILDTPSQIKLLDPLIIYVSVIHFYAVNFIIIFRTAAKILPVYCCGIFMIWATLYLYGFRSSLSLRWLQWHKKFRLFCMRHRLSRRRHQSNAGYTT